MHPANKIDQQVDRRPPTSSRSGNPSPPQRPVLGLRPTTPMFVDSPRGTSLDEDLSSAVGIETSGSGSRPISPGSAWVDPPRVGSPIRNVAAPLQIRQPQTAPVVEHEPLPPSRHAPLLIECPICGRSLSRFIQLKGHLLSHGETPVQMRPSDTPPSILRRLTRVRPL
jgi:hypothetical protein